MPALKHYPETEIIISMSCDGMMTDFGYPNEGMPPERTGVMVIGVMVWWPTPPAGGACRTYKTVTCTILAPVRIINPDECLTRPGRLCRGAHMEAQWISVLSALAGTVIGGTTSFLSSWIVQRQTVRDQWLARDVQRRQDLYKEFIEEASKCYADAIQHDKPNIAALVVPYAKLSRMRVTSSPSVIEAADHVIQQIVDLYSKPTVELTTATLHAMSSDGYFDPLRGFSEACRHEFETLRGKG